MNPHRFLLIALVALASSALLVFFSAAAAGLNQSPTTTFAEPSIVAIRVVRGEPYPTLPADHPGRLGSFPLSEREKRAVQKQPHLDLAHPLAFLDGEGTGVVIDARGLVITPHHVVRGARKIYVVWNGGGSYADIHAADPRSDLAVLRLLDLKSPLKALTPADAAAVARGQLLISHGYLAGATDSASGPACAWGLLETVQTFPTPAVTDSRELLAQRSPVWRMDVRPHIDLCGAAVFTLEGDWVGLRTSSSGGGKGRAFVQPLTPEVQRILTVLKEGREVEYGFLGVSTRDLSEEDLAAVGIKDGSGGVLISEAIAPGLPAAAELRRGDILLAVQGRRIRTGDELFVEIGAAFADSTVTLEIVRDRQRAFAKATLAKLAPLPGVIASERASAIRGLQVDHLTTLLGPTTSRDMQAQVYAALREGGGVVVRSVAADSRAARAGVQVNDLILSVNGKPAATPQAFRKIVEKATGPIELTLPPLQPGQPKRVVRVVD
jgi:serine protease Do